MLKQPELVPVPNEDKYRLLKEYRYSYNNGEVILVPEGFIFDGASVPALLHSMTYSNFQPKVMLAALLHDYMYSVGSVSRYTADSIFYQVLIDSGVSEFTAEAFYQGVRVGGVLFYNTNRGLE